MTIRSYNQYCPIAHALDIVGDRWTLLIVRNLALGPKRFTDLAAGLPGIGTNILTARLKELENQTIVQRRTLPPPAASTVYQLTALGLDLADTIIALSRWGACSLGAYGNEQFVSNESVLLALQSFFGAADTQEGGGTYRVEVTAGESVHTFDLAHTARGLAMVEDVAEPNVFVRTDIETLYALANHQLSPTEAQQRGALTLVGDSAKVARLLQHVGQ